MDKKQRKHAVVHGRVQGVFFRDYTLKKAKQLDLIGWVRNLPDSTVETVFEGDVKMVDEMSLWLKEGSPLSLVSKVEIANEEISGELNDFTILY